MIIGWQIKIVRKTYFYISPIIIKRFPFPIPFLASEYENAEDYLTDDEYYKLSWGFFDGDKSLRFRIHALRQVDMLEHDFKNTDLSEVRKLAEKLKLPW